MSRKKHSGVELPVGSRSSLMWPVAGSYPVKAGWITAEPEQVHDESGRPQPNIRYYLPLSETELYVGFSRMCSHGQPQESSVRQWCERYGLLTGPEAFSPRSGLSLEPEDWLDPVDKGDSRRARDRRHTEILKHSMKLSEFRREARTVWQLLDLYEYLAARNGAAILEVFTDPPPQWPDTPDTIVDRHLRTYRDRYTESYRRQLEKAGLDLEAHHIRVAHELLQRCIELKMRELELRSAVVWTFWDAPEDTRSALLGFELHPKPPNLLAAIYLQLVHLFTDQAGTRRCDWCGTPYPLTKSNRRWCSDGCRSSGREK